MPIENSNGRGEFAFAVGLILVATFLAYFRFFDIFFIYDDLPLLRRTSPQFGNTWLSAILPQNNGFWRPTQAVLAMATETIFGRKPLAFLFVSMLLHATNGILFFLLCRKTLNFPFGTAATATVLFTVSIVGFAAIVQASNSSDLMILTGTFLTILGLEAFDKTSRITALALTTSGLVIGFASKETFVYIAPVMLLMGMVKESPIRAMLKRPFFLVTTSAAFLFAVFFLAQQLSNGQSYASHGTLNINPMTVVRKYCDYIFSLFFPYIHVLDFPFHHLQCPNSVLWTIRLLTIGLMGVAIYFAFASHGKFRRPSLLFLCAAVIVFPASILNFPTESRFFYAASPFCILAIADLLISFIDVAVTRHSIFAFLIAFNILGFYGSESIDRILDCARDVELLVSGTREQSPQWRPGEKIAVLNHPLVAQEPSQWVYRQLVFDVFLEPDKFHYISDESKADADRIFVFDKTGLTQQSP